MDYPATASSPDNYMESLHDKLPKVCQECCDNLGDCTLEDINNFRDYLSELSNKMRQTAEETITVDDFKQAKEEPESESDGDEGD